MKTLEPAFLVAAVLLAGCGTTRHVAVSSYHVPPDVSVGSYRVATAPVHYALRRHSNEPTMVGTTDAIESDVAERGHALPSTQVASAPQRRSRPDTARTESPPKGSPSIASRETTQREPKPSRHAQASSTSTTFPTAKACPDTPGFGMSPFDSCGSYVDVLRYAS